MLPKAVLITGSGNRIGRSIALSLGKEGVQIAIHYHQSSEQALSLLKEIEALGGKATTIKADLSEAISASQLLDQAETKLNQPIDCVINNASIFDDDHIIDFKPDDFTKHMAIHVQAPALIMQAMAQKKRRYDQLVINMIDQRVWALTPRFFTYTLSKATLYTMTKTAAQSLAPYIRVNAIAPGPTLANERQSADDFQKQCDNVLLKRGAELDEFNVMIKAMWQAKSMTGQMIALDGGQHLAWETPDIYNLVE